MSGQSNFEVNTVTTDNIIRASTLKPRLDYATNLVDAILDILVQKKYELSKTNLSSHAKINESISVSEFKEHLEPELGISYAIESLRQSRRCLDSVFGLGNIMLVLAPTISIVRTVRSQLFGLLAETDVFLGELSLVLGGLIIDAGQLTGANLDFQEANRQSCRLLDEAKLIADSKIYKQFPNVDFL
ncbi:MAG TPA: hypothetical protein VLD38_03585 [Nitrosopumilaceae archaeon]|nr:hypothetical protein [Nitrosopumilaceae archaeon]